MTLLVRPSNGYLTHDTNYFTSMDPYCYLYLGKQAQKTAPHYGGGMRPQWKQVMKFSVDNIAKLGIEIWTKAMIGNDTLIGQGMIDLNKLHLSKGTPIQGIYVFMPEYVDVFFSNKPAGRILLQLQYIPPQTHQKPSQIKKIAHKSQIASQAPKNKPERNSWAGDVNWRQSNVSNNFPNYQPQSAIYIADGAMNKNKNNPQVRDKTHGGHVRTGPHEQINSQNKVTQQKANQYLNQQIIKNFAPKLSNVDTNNQAAQKNNPQYAQHQNYQQQQLYEQQKRMQQQQRKLQEQAAQQYQMQYGVFQNANNKKPSTGLTPGTVYAQPDNHYNPNRGSNVQNKPNLWKKSHVGIGNTPPKSILTPPKLNKPKSPGKKVHFVDQV